MKNTRFINHYFIERKKDIETVEIANNIFQKLMTEIKLKKNNIFNFKMKIKDKILKGINLQKLFPDNEHVTDLNLMFVPDSGDIIRGKAKRTSTKDGRQFILIKSNFDVENDNLNFPSILNQFQNELKNKQHIFVHEYSHFYNNILSKGKSSIKQPYDHDKEKDLNMYTRGHEEINSWTRQALSTIIPKYKKNPEHYNNFDIFYNEVINNLKNIDIKGKSVFERLDSKSKKLINKRVGTIYLDLKNSLN